MTTTWENNETLHLFVYGNTQSTSADLVTAIERKVNSMLFKRDHHHPRYRQLFYGYSLGVKKYFMTSLRKINVGCTHIWHKIKIRH